MNELTMLSRWDAVVDAASAENQAMREVEGDQRVGRTQKRPKVPKRLPLLTCGCCGKLFKDEAIKRGRDNYCSKACVSELKAWTKRTQNGRCI